MQIKYTTLNQFIEELKTIAEQKDKHLNMTMGEMSVLSIGCCCGQIYGKQNPYMLRLKDFEADADREIYVNSEK